MYGLPSLHANDANFVATRERRGLYVDKTASLRKLLATDSNTRSTPLLESSHQFLARPRRFGKTLLVNTLEAWFQGLPPEHPLHSVGESMPLENMPGDWTSPDWLWEGLAGEDWHGEHGWHPVIRLDLSMGTSPSPEGTHERLQMHLLSVINEWQERSGPRWLGISHAFQRNDHPADSLAGLIRDLFRTYRVKPVVLVDEYDAPIVKHIGTDRDVMPSVEALQDFFRVLKDDAGLLYGVFVTGITRFASHHLFSAANNFTDISDNPEYGGICGFSEEDVDSYFAPYRSALTEREPRLDEDAVRDAWAEHYNGYRFSAHPSAPRVYNPFTLTSGVHQLLSNPEVLDSAVRGTWPSAWSRSGHAGLTARLAADTRQRLPDAVRTGGIPALPAPGVGDVNRPNYYQVMLDTGYYTWHGGGDGTVPYLDFPNLEVAESWAYDVLGLWEYDPGRDGSIVDGLAKCLEEGDLEAFGRQLENFVFGLAHQNLQGEPVYRTLLQSLIRQMGFPTQSEKSNWGGRSDHEVHVGDRVYVFEVKVDQSANTALRQIRERGYGREYLDGMQVTAVGLAFRKDLKEGPCLQVAHADLPQLLSEREAPRLPGAL